MPLLMMLAACGVDATPIPPTNTPRPTLPPREAPTALPPPVDAGEIQRGETVTVTLPGQTFVNLTYSVVEPETVTVTGRALTDDGAGNALDVVLELLDSQNNRISYDDDGGLASNDAAITDVELQPDTYTIRVNAFNGFQRGEVEIKVE